MVWEGGPPRSSQILVVVVSRGFVLFFLEEEFPGLTREGSCGLGGEAL